MDRGQWDDWIPGVLSQKQLKVLADNDLISNVNGEIGESSIDLCISDNGFISRLDCEIRFRRR